MAGKLFSGFTQAHKGFKKAEGPGLSKQAFVDAYVT
jgi:hypothetical protein